MTLSEATPRLTTADVPEARVTAAAAHKDVSLPDDHGDWYICDASPTPGTSITAATTVRVELAAKASDCDISYHGYLDQKNDPAYTPPPALTPKPTPTPRPAETGTPPPQRSTPEPAPDSLITCPDGKPGYACTSNGHPVVDGQFCPKADRGRTLKATNGKLVTCSYDPSVTPYRWQ